MTNTETAPLPVPTTIDEAHGLRVRYNGHEGTVQSCYARAGVLDEIVIDLGAGRVIGDLDPADVEWLPAFSTDDEDDDEPDREPSAEAERAWNEQYDGTSFGI